MRLRVPYEKDFIELEVAERNLRGILDLKDVKAGEFTEVFKEGMETPLNSPSFEEFLEKGKKHLLIVNDATRPTPTARVLEHLYPFLKEIDFKLIVATGSHRAPTEEELRFIFGKLYEPLKKENKILVHHAKDDKRMVHLGFSKRGTPVYINESVLEADKLITINSVEPHYFAGYTGGRKSFVPGVSGYTTIEKNHSWAVKPEAKTLALKGNPVHEDMEEIASMIDKPVFSIQTVLDGEKNLYKLVCGELKESFYRAAEYANHLYTAEFQKKVDIVISVAPYPMDINLYQAQKAIENGKLALKKDGILILVARCRDGIGPENFYNLLKSSESCEKILEYIEKNYVLGYHKAGKIAEMNLWAQIWAVTDIEDEKIKKAKIVPKPSLQEAVDHALKEKGKEAEIYYLPNGSMTVPIQKRC